MEKCLVLSRNTYLKIKLIALFSSGLIDEMCIKYSVLSAVKAIGNMSGS